MWILSSRYVITELMQSDLHKIIVSPQHLSADHIKVFLYQILRGKLLVEFITNALNGILLTCMALHKHFNRLPRRQNETPGITQAHKVKFLGPLAYSYVFSFKFHQNFSGITPGVTFVSACIKSGVLLGRIGGRQRRCSNNSRMA